MRNKFRFIVLEGSDGSGKATQTKLLSAQLKKNNFIAKTISFPQYNCASSYFVKQYLRGAYGAKEEVSPYTASLFYALDRWEAKEKIKKWLKQNFMVIADRYLPSNLAHQGAKIKNAQERKKFYQWALEMEYKKLFLPRPDIIFLLHLPAEISFELIEHKKKRNYLKGGKRDIHEKDLIYLKKVEAVYLEIARLFNKEFKIIECVENKKLLSPKEISQKIGKVLAKNI